MWRVLLGKNEGEEPRGRVTNRWEDIITMDLKVLAWEGKIRIRTCGGLLWTQ
jgi:hypothetical protein